MPCIAAPKVPVPTLAGLSLAPPALPSVSFDPNLCCKQLPFSIPTPPLPLGAGMITPATIAIVTQAMAKIQTFLASLSIPCPKE